MPCSGGSTREVLRTHVKTGGTAAAFAPLPRRSDSDIQHASPPDLTGANSVTPTDGSAAMSDGKKVAEGQLGEGGGPGQAGAAQKKPLLGLLVAVRGRANELELFLSHMRSHLTAAGPSPPHTAIDYPASSLLPNIFTQQRVDCCFQQDSGRP